MMQGHAITEKHVAEGTTALKRSKRKRFALEWRAKHETLKRWGEDSMFYRWHHEWTRFNAYATERARDEAMRTQVHKLGHDFDFRGVDL